MQNFQRLIIKVKKVYAIQISFNVLPKGGILYKYRKTAKVIKFLSYMKFFIFNQTKKLVSLTYYFVPITI